MEMNLIKSLNAIARHNRECVEEEFIDVFDIDESSTCIRGFGIGLYNFVKTNPELIRNELIKGTFNKEFLTRRNLEEIQTMNINKCTECENETMLKYADLAVELERYKEYYTKLNKCLDTKDDLCRILREDNERYRNLYELWKEKAIKLQEEKE